jgi:hypothetical protein
MDAMNWLVYHYRGNVVCRCETKEAAMEFIAKQKIPTEYYYEFMAGQ